MLTGIANAFLDSVPLVAITGQVNTTVMGTDAFQEVDIFGMALPVVKHSYIIRHTEDIPRVIAEAFEIAQSGRPGPVLIDLPKDVTVRKIDQPVMPRHENHAGTSAPADEIARAEELMRQAKKPVLYIGGGVVLAGAVKQLRAFAARTGIPAVATLKALGTLPTDDPQFIGMLGMHGLKAANLAVHDSDLLINIGARFDDRVTGRLDSFAPNAKIIHLDIDVSEIGKLRAADVALHGGMVATLDELNPGPLAIDAWRAEINGMKAEHAWRYDAPGEGVYAPAFLKQLSETADSSLIVTCDVGQHQMWVAQHCRFRRPEAHLTSGGLGTMGYGVPAGIGAQLAEPKSTVITVSGDGSIMMNIQELATLNRYKIPLKIVVLDNSHLGMVRQWQELFFAGNYSEVDLSDNPDFAEVARAFGLQALSLSKRADAPRAIEQFLAAEGPVLLHVKIDPQENVWPLVPPGKSNHEMMEGESYE